MTCRKCKKPMRRVRAMFKRSKTGEHHTTYYDWECTNAVCGCKTRTRVDE